MPSVRSSLIRLARLNPDGIRKYLLPLIRKAGQPAITIAPEKGIWQAGWWSIIRTDVDRNGRQLCGIGMVQNRYSPHRRGYRIVIDTRRTANDHVPSSLFSAAAKYINAIDFNPGTSWMSPDELREDLKRLRKIVQ